MNRWMYTCVAVGLLLLAAPAGAQIPDNLEIGTSSAWVTAGGEDAITLTVQASNSSNPVSGVTVDFTVDRTYGSISPARAVTDSAGKATAVFTPGTRSGDVTVTATVVREGMEPLVRSFDQRIDHAAPYAVVNIWYEPEVTAGETTEIVVRVADRYGNPVDCRREDALHAVPETVRFMVGSPAGFVVDGSCTDDILVPVDTAGNATSRLRVDTAAGENLVMIQPPVPGRSDYISIAGVANGIPFSIAPVIDPPGASVPADGDKVVSFTYTLFDKYGNPVAGRGLWVNASITRGDRPEERESALLYSNSHGQVMITYGPEDSVGIATVTATAAANASVTNSTAVEFTSTEPVNMLLSASPQAMPSRDVRPAIVSELRAKVMDVKGNPVSGEVVTFAIVSSSAAPYNQTVEPILKNTSAITNAEGYAIIEFCPGAFTTDRSAPGWSDTATGTATVRATWNGTARTIPLTWKNYPYLSVETEVSPETVAVNETVDVTIRLRGDGWALQPDPIDVVLCTDRSGSMLKDYPDRMVKAMEASRLFNTQMNYPRDHLGLVSFGRTGNTDLIGYGYRYWLGWDDTNNDDLSYRSDHYPYDPKYYADYAVVDLPMSDDPSLINATIGQMVPDWGTPMRSGIYKAINELKVNGSADAVRAVVVLSDGDYNHYGDPLARGSAKASWNPSEFSDLTKDYFPFDGLGNGWTSNQNMSVYAMSNNIRIYSIAFARDITDGGKKTLRTLAESTGGKYYYADTGEDLARVYTDIAGELKTEAGVDTELDVAFENVEVNGALVSGAGVFDYVYGDGVSTTIASWVENETGNYTIVSFKTVDQTADWNADHNLNFNIGTVRLNQVWETTFRLKVKTDGNINVFGPGSTITFNNGIDTLTLPDTFITAVADLNNTGITSCSLAVDLADPVPPAGRDAFTDVIPLTWTITYNGTRKIDEALAYSGDGGRSWTVFWTKTVDRSTTRDETLMDVTNLPPGDYLIRLVASALDAPDAVSVTNGSICIGNASRVYIQIE